MNKNYWIKKAATALGLILVVKLLSLPFAVACPFLQCANFTDPKKEDCGYIISQDFSKDEEQEVLCTLWEADYDYQNYQPPIYPLIDTDLALNYDELDTSSLILASKIILLIFFSYFVYCVLTKPSFIRKWVAV